MSDSSFMNREPISMRSIAFPKSRLDWQNASANFSDEKLEILGHPVMEAWEKPYMRELAKIATQNGGTILEVGFGMAISAGYIQQAKIEEHIIIEGNAEVFAKAEEFAKQAKQKVTPILGFWQDVVGSLSAASFDGILYDAYPLSQEEVYGVHTSYFFKEAYRLLKKGGVFTYFCGRGVESLSEKDSQLLKETGFLNIGGTVCEVTPPADCLYWNEKTIFAPIIIK